MEVLLKFSLDLPSQQSTRLNESFYHFFPGGEFVDVDVLSDIRRT